MIAGKAAAAAAEEKPSLSVLFLGDGKREGGREVDRRTDRQINR